MQDAVKVCSADPPFYTSHTTLESADYSWGHFFLSIVRLYDSAVERQTNTAGTPVNSTPTKEILSASTSLSDI